MKPRSLPGYVAFAGVLFFAFAVVASAQSRTNSTGTGGIHQIKGRVYAPDGSTFDTSIEVKLESTSYGTLKVSTDDAGSYAFTNLGPGNYTVVVNAGDQFEVTRESVTIDPEIQTTMAAISRTRVFTVPVYLQFKRNTRSDELTGVVQAKWATTPKEAVHHLEKGNSLAADKQLDKAEAEFRKSLEIAPSFAPARTALGKLLLTEGKIADSVHELEIAVEGDPHDFDARFTYGVALMENKKIDQAQKELDQAAALDKTAVTPRYYLGQIYVQKKDLDSALKEFEAARDLTGKRVFPLLHRYLGGIYVLKGRNKEAVAELEVYVAQDPNAKDIDRIKQTIEDLRAKLN